MSENTSTTTTSTTTTPAPDVGAGNDEPVAVANDQPEGDEAK
jgi:hypothetical protein